MNKGGRPRKSGKTIHMTMRIEENLRDKLKLIAKYERRSVNSLIQILLEDGVRRRQ